MGNGDELVVWVLDEGGGALDRADAVDQPVAVDLEHTRHLGQAVDGRLRRAAAQDVIDEGPVHARHLGDMGRRKPELVGPGTQAVGKGVVHVHLVPRQVWIDQDMTGLMWDRQETRTNGKHSDPDSGGLMEIEKAYFTLEEILERWAMREVDLRYLAETDQLRLSIRCFNLPMEFGDHEETDDGRYVSIPWEQGYYSGLLDLSVRDVFQIFRNGEVQTGYFRSTRAAYACLWGIRESLTIRKSDLVLRREERDRIEAERGFFGAVAAPKMQSSGFEASADYLDVRCAGYRFQLGAIQAKVVRLLHEAAQRGDPWQSGKQVLAAAGSRSLKMADVFKSKKDWPQLIESNGRGSYRLRGC